MVLLDNDKQELVIQGLKADDALNAEVGGTTWVEGHDLGIPGHEAVVRIPYRMIPILRKACDDAERDELR
ncbi:hypothetical protein ACFWJ4_16610 [Kitasatospora sp. NPDC127067]|uniref:hypothetical protein n=1 Tax=Kitasatospora sp. NPDC127067 TaxID=3347126 RepID=UPI00366742AB